MVDSVEWCSEKTICNVHKLDSIPRHNGWSVAAPYSKSAASTLNMNVPIHVNISPLWHDITYICHIVSTPHDPMGSYNVIINLMVASFHLGLFILHSWMSCLDATHPYQIAFLICLLIIITFILSVIWVTYWVCLCFLLLLSLFPWSRNKINKQNMSISRILQTPSSSGPISPDVTSHLANVM